MTLDGVRAMEVSLNWRKTIRALFSCMALLAFMHLVVWMLVYVFGINRKAYLVAVFDLNHEANIPTLFSSILLLLCAAGLAYISQGIKQRGRPYRAWLGLSWIFVFLAFDETAEIHEQLVGPLRALVNGEGLLRYTWVLGYMALLVVLAIIYARWYMGLPGRTRLAFTIAGAIYIGGAIVVESLGGLQRSTDPNKEHYALFCAIVGVEEVLEMSGALLFLKALLAYAESELGAIRLALGQLQGEADQGDDAAG